MQSLVRLALTSPVVELRFPPKPRLAVDLFIDHVARNAILQVFVYDNSPHQTVWRWFLVFCFHFSPHSEIFRRKKSRCAMTHADFTCEWSISMGCLHSLCKFYWVKILRNNDFMMEPSSGNIGDAEASTRVVKIYSAHKTRLALKIHNKKKCKTWRFTSFANFSWDFNMLYRFATRFFCATNFVISSDLFSADLHARWSRIIDEKRRLMAFFLVALVASLPSFFHAFSLRVFGP